MNNNTFFISTTSQAASIFVLLTMVIIFYLKIDLLNGIDKINIFKMKNVNNLGKYYNIQEPNDIDTYVNTTK